MSEKHVFKETGAWLEYDPVPDARGVVVICPGGGYQFLSPREAEPVARRFAAAGWQPLVLKYSVGGNLGRRPLREAAWAVRTARQQFADSSGASPCTALCGFSAGGHLAASLGTHWDDTEEFPDPAQRQAQRPDGLILAYPVITRGQYRHADSFARLHLEGGAPDYFSLEKWVTPATPPAFLWHTSTDETVPVENSLLFAQALRANRVPVELHIYPFGPHGMSLATPEVEEAEKGRRTDPHVAGWFDLCLAWLDILRKHVREKT